MRLVDGEQGNPGLVEQSEEAGCEQALGGNVEQVKFAV